MMMPNYPTNLDNELDKIFRYWNVHYSNVIQVMDYSTNHKAVSRGYTDESGVWHEPAQQPDSDLSDNSMIVKGEIVAPNNYKASHWQQTANGSLTIIDMDWYSRHCEFGIDTQIYVKSTDTTYKVVAKSDYRPHAQYAEYGLKSIERQVANDVPTKTTTI